MAGRQTGVRKIASVVHKTPKQRIISIDIEGNPEPNYNAIREISFVDGAGIVLADEKSDGGVLTKSQRETIQRCLDFALVLVGFNLNADLKVLADNGFYLNPNVVCIDCDWTFQHPFITSEHTAWAKWQRGHNGTLKAVCQYFGIEAKNFHTSIVDAICSMKLFWALLAQTERMVVLMRPKAERRIISSADVMIKTEGAVIDMESNGAADTHQFKIGDLISVPESKAKNHYEGMVEFEGVTFIIHLNAKEYDLFQRIQALNPEYTLNCFYETILRQKQINFLAEKWAKDHEDIEPVSAGEEETD